MATQDEPDKHEAAAQPLSARDAMAFMQRMWNPFGLSMPGSATGAGAPGDPSPESGAAPQSTAHANAIPAFMPGPLPFPNPAAMFAALDPAEVARRIAELRVIEGWLAMSLNLMQMSIKTLELQQASLEALHAAHAPAKPRGGGKRRKGE